MNLKSTFAKINETLPTTGEDILDALGLERRRSTAEKVLPVIGVFAAGLLVGAGLSLLLSPRSGPEIREQIGGVVRNRLRGGDRIDAMEGTEERHRVGGLPHGV